MPDALAAEAGRREEAPGFRPGPLRVHRPSRDGAPSRRLLPEGLRSVPPLVREAGGQRPPPLGFAVRPVDEPPLELEPPELAEPELPLEREGPTALPVEPPCDEPDEPRE